MVCQWSCFNVTLLLYPVLSPSQPRPTQRCLSKTCLIYALWITKNRFARINAFTILVMHNDNFTKKRRKSTLGKNVAYELSAQKSITNVFFSVYCSSSALPSSSLIGQFTTTSRCFTAPIWFGVWLAITKELQLAFFTKIIALHFTYTGNLYSKFLVDYFFQIQF